MAWFFPFLLILTLHLGMGAWGGMMTTAHLTTWYDGLIKSPLTPPDWVFSSVWTTLYILMAIAMTRVRVNREAIMVGLVQLGLNISWVYFFFVRESIMAGLIALPAVGAAAALTMYAYSRVDRLAAALYVPYVLWLLFAFFLNFRLWQLN